MSFWNSQSISGKITRMNLLVSGTALLLAYLSFLGYDLLSLRRNLVDSVGTEAAIVGANSVTALMFDDQQAAEQTLSALQSSPHIVAAVIYKPDGSLLARYVRDRGAAISVLPKLGQDETYGYWSARHGIELGRKIIFADRVVGSVYLLAETSDLMYRAKQFGFISAFILALCFVIAVVATSAMRRLLSQPLSDLASTAQIVTRDRDYSVRARVPRSTDELTALVHAFNEMLEQIQHRDHALEESRAELEERVQERTTELLAANKELEAFSYSVAHDLRGPLQHIGNISFLLEQSCGAGDPQCASLIEKLFEGTQRMSTLIDDLLNLSRATSTPLHRTAINLSNMANSIVEMLRMENPERDVEVFIARGAHVIADEGLMMVVLENLLRNSWKYTSRAKPARIEFGFHEEPSGTIFTVQDNGVGFNPRYVDRLFRPFQRLHSQGEFPGTGVGLATVSRIIGRHGGKIWASGNIDQGAQFSFTIPYGE